MTTDNGTYQKKIDLHAEGWTLRQVGWLAYADTDHESLYTDVARGAAAAGLVPVYRLVARVNNA